MTFARRRNPDSEIRTIKIALVRFVPIQSHNLRRHWLWKLFVIIFISAAADSCIMQLLLWQTVVPASRDADRHTWDTFQSHCLHRLWDCALTASCHLPVALQLDVSSWRQLAVENNSLSGTPIGTPADGRMRCVFHCWKTSFRLQCNTAMKQNRRQFVSLTCPTWKMPLSTNDWNSSIHYWMFPRCRKAHHTSTRWLLGDVPYTWALGWSGHFFL